MDCNTCHERLPKVGLYCPHCGTKIDKPNYVEPSLISPSNDMPTPKVSKLPSKGESMAFRAKLIKDRTQANKAKLMKAWIRLTVLSVLFLLGSVLMSISGFDQFKIINGIIILSYLPLCLLILLIRILLRKNVNETEYYTIPGSRNHKGHYRCINCGGHGLYRYTSFRSSRENHARCTQCQIILFNNK